ncbi:hypothetical protein M0804_008609 [Polistes exclamans]|nr:hypothetical protein M0804_008609 [Polistes exclamans]
MSRKEGSGWWWMRVMGVTEGLRFFIKSKVSKLNGRKSKEEIQDRYKRAWSLFVPALSYTIIVTRSRAYGVSSSSTRKPLNNNTNNRQTP